MPSIDERIAELQQRIAEKKAYQRMYRPNRNMAAWDYVAEGDRSGYDKIDASEAAYHNMLAQQRFNEQQRLAQQAYNSKEKALDRELSLQIANKNREASDAAKMDEYKLNHTKAYNSLNAAQETLRIAQEKGNVEDIAKASLQLEQAKADYAYWSNKVGFKPTVSTPQEIPQEPTPEPTPEPVNENVLLEKANGLSAKSDLSTMESTLKELQSHPRRNQNKDFQSRIDKLTKLIKDKKQWLADEQFMKTWKEGEPFDENKFKLNISKGVVSLVRK
jgi:hypothetical protein